MFDINPAAFTVLNLAGWWLLPDFASRKGLAMLHSFLRSRGRHVPQPGTLQYVSHWRAMYTVVIVGYLIYSLFNSIKNTPSNYYEVLGVHPYATQLELKAAFRYFARRNHPDRIGPQGEAVFIAVRDAYDSLKDPVKRFAYNRFGPEALQWKDSTALEALYSGAKTQVGFYAGSLLMLLFTSFVSESSPITFWRYFLLVGLLAIELQLVLIPDLPSFPIKALNSLFPYRVPYQHILFVHQLYVSFTIALTRVFPVIFAPDPMESKDPRTMRNIAEKVLEMVKLNNSQVAKLYLTELQALWAPASASSTTKMGMVSSPLQSGSLPSSLQPPVLDEETLTLLADELETLLIDQALRSHPGLQPTLSSARSRIKALRQAEEEATVDGDVLTNGPASPSTSSARDADEENVSPSVGGRRFRFLSPESDDGRDYRKNSNAREMSRSPSPP